MDFVEFKVGSAVNFYAPPIITIFGTAGKLWSLLLTTVWKKKSQ